MEWASRVAPKAIRRLLEVCGDREPRGLMLDMVRLAASVDEMALELSRALRRIEQLEEKLQARQALIKHLDHEIESLRNRGKK